MGTALEDAVEDGLGVVETDAETDADDVVEAEGEAVDVEVAVAVAVAVEEEEICGEGEAKHFWIEAFVHLMHLPL